MEDRRDNDDLSSPLLPSSNRRQRRPDGSNNRRHLLSRSLPPQRNLPLTLSSSSAPPLSTQPLDADADDAAHAAPPLASNSPSAPLLASFNKFSSARPADGGSLAGGVAWHPRLDVTNTLASHALAEGRNVAAVADRKRTKARKGAAAERGRRRRVESGSEEARGVKRAGTTSFSDQSTEYRDSDADFNISSYDREDEGELQLLPSDRQTKHNVRTILKATLVILASSAGAAASLASMLSTQVIIVIIAGAVCLGTVPFVWVGEWRLFQLPALRTRLNDLRSEANRLRDELQILMAEEMDLKEELQRMHESHVEVETLVQREMGGNIDQIVDLVRENQEILTQMKENLRQVVLQDVVKLVLQSDIDRDGIISRSEAKLLEFRITVSLKLYGIVFDAEKFQRAIGLSPSLCGVMAIVKRLLPDENGFVDDHEDVGSLSEEDDEDEDDGYGAKDAYDMYYIDVEEQTQRGCKDTMSLCKEYVQKKGKRPMLMSISPSMRRSMRGLRCTLLNIDCDCDDNGTNRK